MTQAEADAYYAGSVNIAFIGQVPVKIIGSANIGDLVLPSGNNDGTGIAVSRLTATASQYASSVGTILSVFSIPENTRAGLKPIYEQMMVEDDISDWNLYKVAVGTKSFPIQFLSDLNLEAIAGISTPIPGSNSETFMTAFYNKLSSWLADAGNGITNIFANTFRASNQLCINDTCVTEFQLQSLLQNSGTGSSSSGGSSTPPLADPTCSDGIQNQDETGVDTGGYAVNPCQCHLVQTEY